MIQKRGDILESDKKAESVFGNEAGGFGKTA